jgi:DHA2 family multidrug resistance protein
MSHWQKPAFFTPANPFFHWLILLNVLVTTFMSLLSAGVTIIANSSIQGELALSNPEAAWVTIFYMLGVNTMVPAATWFADRYGYKLVYAIGVLIFTLGSGFAGFAYNFPFLGFSRFIEGIGAGLIFPVGLAMIARNIPKEKLALALNLYIAIGFGAGFGLGIPLSGYLAVFHSWRVVFYLILPIGLIATIDCWLFHEETPKVENGHFDLWGFASFATFIATLLIALSFGALPSTDGGWTSPLILFCFATAALAFICTILIEKSHPNPIIPLQLFKNPIFVVSATALFLLGMALFASISSSVDFMLNALKYDKYITGLIGAVYGISMAGASVLANILIKKIPVPLLLLFGLFLLVASYFINNEITMQSYPGQLIMILFLRGMGVGLSLGPTTGLAMHGVAKELAGKAATLLTFFRQVGGTYGGTVITIIVIKRQIFHIARFSETVNQHIPGYRETWAKLATKFFTQVSDKGILAGKQAELSIAQTIATQAYVQSINDAMIVFGCVTLITALILLFLIAKKMWENRKAATLQGP